MVDAILAFGMPGTFEWVVILVVGLLVFGRRLPDVARSVGRSVVEFKKGMREVREEIDDGMRVDSPSSPRLEKKSESPAAASNPTPDAKH